MSRQPPDGRERYGATTIRPLVDAEIWPPLEEALRSARRRVDLTQLLFEAGFKPRGRALTDLIEDAARRGARVRVLVNENAAIPDSFDELRVRFAGTPVEVASLPMTPNVLHSKLLIADDDVFMIDAPFEQKYADSQAHPFSSTTRRHWHPFHSVSLHLAGPVVARIAQLFDTLWAGGILPAPDVPRAAADQPGVELAWTAPAGAWAREPAARVLEAYERALREARRFVYVETQYLTSPRIVDAIAAALAREPRLEVILLLNEHMDVPTYDAWQARRLRELGYPDHPRLGAFSLWAPRRARDDTAVRRIYIHSKACIVDDAWATLGSANLDSISLHDADEFGVRVARNVELNAVFDDPGFAASLRRRLWGEHLADEGVWREQEPPGGWLAHWREIADANLARFNASETCGPARIMPYGALTTSWREGISRPPGART